MHPFMFNQFCMFQHKTKKGYKHNPRNKINVIYFALGTC